MDFELVDVEPPRPRDNGVVSVDGILLRGRELAAAAAEVGVLRKRKDLQRNVASFRMAEMSTGLGRVGSTSEKYHDTLCTVRGMLNCKPTTYNRCKTY